MAGERNEYGKRSRSRSEHNDDSNKNDRSKRRSKGEFKGRINIAADDTVYRYLCPTKKIGTIMGKGGDIAKQLRSETNSKLDIGETVSGCDERVITIYSVSDETNDIDGFDERVCPAQDALFKVHDRVVDVAGDGGDDDGEEEEAAAVQVTARLLVATDQIGCVIGKGGHVVESIRSDTGAQIRIMRDRHMPTCALPSDELLQVSGEASHVRKALFQLASRLHHNPSRSQHLLTSSNANMYLSGGSVMGTTGAPIIVAPYSGYKGEDRDWARSLYPAPRRDSSLKEFSLRLICPAASVGSVIGKGGSIINQIRQESGATINVNSSAADAEDCIISISSKEMFEDSFSPTIEAAIRLQPRCSDTVERDSGHASYTTRLLVPTSQIGCLIGRGGAKITEMRRTTRANIKIFSKENIPKVAEDDDEMVQIIAELDLAKDALIQVATRLRGDLFEREGALSTFVPVLPYLPMAPEAPEISRYERRDSKGHGRGNSYSGRYGSSTDLPHNDAYRGYDSSQGRTSAADYGAYGGHSSGRSSTYGGSRHDPPSRRRYHPY
uniref:KH domain-containing protein HEN4-like n=1 Tax=Erigeron canadensis TaxID=72917 RepID=UPI001CB99DD8|nr:KH domain-containing protein HEN4-like [Erigeron canadensis]